MIYVHQNKNVLSQCVDKVFIFLNQTFVYIIKLFVYVFKVFEYRK